MTLALRREPFVGGEGLAEEVLFDKLLGGEGLGDPALAGGGLGEPGRMRDPPPPTLLLDDEEGGGDGCCGWPNARLFSSINRLFSSTSAANP